MYIISRRKSGIVSACRDATGIYVGELIFRAVLQEISFLCMEAGTLWVDMMT